MVFVVFADIVAVTQVIVIVVDDAFETGIRYVIIVIIVVAVAADFIVAVV